MKEYPLWGAVDLGDGTYGHIVSVSNLEEITVLVDQLEALVTLTNTHVDNIEPLLTALNTYVDGLESISTTINSNVDQLESIATTTSATATTISNSVDGLETLLQGVIDQVKPASTIGNGTKNVTTAGTQLPLSDTSVPCRSVIVTAKKTNAGEIAVGGTSVDAAVDTTFLASESITLHVNNLNAVYIDSTVNGEGVTYVYTV